MRDSSLTRRTKYLDEEDKVFARVLHISSRVSNETLESLTTKAESLTRRHISSRVSNEEDKVFGDMQYAYSLSGASGADAVVLCLAVKRSLCSPRDAVFGDMQYVILSSTVVRHLWAPWGGYDL